MGSAAREENREGRCEYKVTAGEMVQNKRYIYPRVRLDRPENSTLTVHQPLRPADLDTAGLSIALRSRIRWWWPGIEKATLVIF